NVHAFFLRLLLPPGRLPEHWLARQQQREREFGLRRDPLHEPPHRREVQRDQNQTAVAEPAGQRKNPAEALRVREHFAQRQLEHSLLRAGLRTLFLIEDLRPRGFEQEAIIHARRAGLLAGPTTETQVNVP